MKYRVNALHLNLEHFIEFHCFNKQTAQAQEHERLLVHEFVVFELVVICC